MLTEQELEQLADRIVKKLKPSPLLNEALRGLEKDPHYWSSRPCVTCKAISQALERPFGCETKKTT